MRWTSGLVAVSGVTGLLGLAWRSEAPLSASVAASAVNVPAKPTYSEHVAPILNAHCVSCHRPGAVAPFSLIGYEEARRRAGTASEAVRAKLMPPWKASQGFGEFRDENRLSPAEIETLARWYAEGAPAGDLKKAPSSPRFESDWTLGKPDLVLTPTAPYSLGAEGNDEYVNFILPTNFKETRWIRAMDIRPGNNRIVHHVIAYLDARGNSIQLAKSEGGEWYRTFGGVGFLPSGSLGGWAPGLIPAFTPEGTAYRLEPGTTVVLQVHYHRTGKTEQDQTKVALYFAKQPVRQEMHLAWYMNVGVNIAPNDPDYHITQRRRTQNDTTFYAVMPHMHLLGKKMTATATLPDGTIVPLIKIEDWDFNWQMSYAFKKPIHLPKGTLIEIEAVYDNSTGNPRNPNDPPQRVTFGEQTTDEMFLMLAGYTVDNEPITAGPFNQFLRFP